MLNPGAIEFKPALTKAPQTNPSFSNDTNKATPSIKPNETNSNRTSNKARKHKPASHATPTNVTTKLDTTITDQVTGSSRKSTTKMTASSSSQQQGDHPLGSRRKHSSKQKTSTTSSSTPTTTQQQQKQDHQHQKKSSRQAKPAQNQRRSSSHTATTTTVTAVTDPNELEPTTSFITIDQTIDPVHIIPGALALKNTIAHGYDRYITWIERCLQAHAVVTLVGMDPAISDVLSLVTIMQEKGIGSCHELETFSMEDGVGGGRQQQHPISGIQLRLHRY